MKKLLVIMLLIVSCSPTPKTKPLPSGDVCTDACQNMAYYGCPEGLASNCASTCNKVQSEAITDLKPVCLSTAQSISDLRECGTVKCVK